MLFLNFILLFFLLRYNAVIYFHFRSFNDIIFFTGELAKSPSESSLSDACETTSAKESARRHDDKDVCSDTDTRYAEEPVDSCDEAKSYDNDKDNENEKETTHPKLQKQGNVVMRRKSKGNPLFRKSK